MTGARLKHYGWGREGEGMSAEERKFVLGRYRAKFATDEFDTIVVPGLDDLSLREPRVVLRHFPQSFEFSTPGGWNTTRSGGHFASLHTHIDDFVESNPGVLIDP